MHYTASYASAFEDIFTSAQNTAHAAASLLLKTRSPGQITEPCSHQLLNRSKTINSQVRRVIGDFKGRLHHNSDHAWISDSPQPPMLANVLVPANSLNRQQTASVWSPDRFAPTSTPMPATKSRAQSRFKREVLAYCTPKGLRNTVQRQARRAQQVKCVQQRTGPATAVEIATAQSKQRPHRPPKRRRSSETENERRQLPVMKKLRGPRRKRGPKQRSANSANAGSVATKVTQQAPRRAPRRLKRKKTSANRSRSHDQASRENCENQPPYKAALRRRNKTQPRRKRSRFEKMARRVEVAEALAAF